MILPKINKEIKDELSNNSLKCLVLECLENEIRDLLFNGYLEELNEQFKILKFNVSFRNV